MPVANTGYWWWRGTTHNRKRSEVGAVQISLDSPPFWRQSLDFMPKGLYRWILCYSPLSTNCVYSTILVIVVQCLQVWDWFPTFQELVDFSTFQHSVSRDMKNNWVRYSITVNIYTYIFSFNCHVMLQIQSEIFVLLKEPSTSKMSGTQHLLCCHSNVHLKTNIVQHHHLKDSKNCSNA